MRLSREQRVHNLKVKLAFQYGIIGFVFGSLWSLIAQISKGVVGSSWLGGLTSGIVIFILFGHIIMRLLSYLGDRTTETLLDKSPEYSKTGKCIFNIFFFGIHGAIIGTAAYFILSYSIGLFQTNNVDLWWYIGGGILGLIPAVWYGWTEVE